MTLLLMLIVGLIALYIHARLTMVLAALSVIAVAQMYFEQWARSTVVGYTALLVLITLLLTPNPLRSHLISRHVMRWLRNKLPRLSETESEALLSGDVDWDGELFSGRPHWWRLLNARHVSLSDEERAFVDGPTNQLCEMLDDWRITNEYYDLPQDVWRYIKDNGFFGLVIPKEYGGKGFSATAHSEVVMTLSTRSVSAAVTVMVPNSLGPAELLIHHGTDIQKNYYLPRLAKGEEIPCFALTSPLAGSDAGAIPDVGIVSKGIWKGEEVLGLRITWNKRYITLAPVATLIGLAIKVVDPDHLLGERKELGVTCILVPHDLPGVHRGPRHLPMNTVFMNGPTWGDDVFVSMEQVIGGVAMIGKGWSMLLESLSIGRSISLPALGTGAGKYTCLTTGSYAAVREQFGRSIAAFEGVQEALEPIAGYTYMMDAARRFTTSMIDSGIRPTVPSAILKYRNTELMRKVVNHAMDIVAGRAVIAGPRNFLARVYQAIPISITVEGANILTRSLMIYGQGAVRCHPYLLKEIQAASNAETRESLKVFDQAYFGHVGFALGNVLRAFLLALSNGLLSLVPTKGGLKYYYRQINRFSAAFALLTDVNLAMLGSSLKARERISGRMADCLIYMYFASAVIKQFHEDAYQEYMRPLAEWSLKTNLYDMQEQMRRVINNYPARWLRPVLRVLIFPWGLRVQHPSDELGTKVANTIVQDLAARKYLIKGAYITEKSDDAVGRVLNAYRLSLATANEEQKLYNAIKNSDEEDLKDLEMLLARERQKMLRWALQEHVLDSEEIARLESAMDAVYDAIQVDAFPQETIANYRREGFADMVVEEEEVSPKKCVKA